MSKLISVIVPVYNVEDYIERCIDSIIKQTYKNLEILLVDDGATDKSGKLCDEFAKMDDRIKVIHKKNGGLSSARNAALDVATGDYIGFVDSDDYVHPKMFEKLLEACEDNTSEICVCCHFVEKENEIIIDSPIDDNVRLYDKQEALRLLVSDKVFKNYAWDKLYKAELFAGVRYPEGRNYEDIATTYLLFDKCDKICYIPEYLYYYQVREGSISAHVSDKQWHKNCEFSLLGQKERLNYFLDKNTKIATLSLGMMVKYIYSYIDTGSILNDIDGVENWKNFLLENEYNILNNQYVSDKDKKLLKVYTMSNLKYKLYCKGKKPVKTLNNVSKKVKKVINSCGYGISEKYDFSLDEGKTTRLILFEIPSFDNLGDQAIAYADKVFLEDYVKQNQNMQLYVIDGWDTVDAVNQLKGIIRPNDVIFCQGGGNLGNLYPFADAFRNKILKAFKNHRIIIFPQTIYFTNDKVGQREKIKCIKVYRSCHNLTLCARDNYSYELMKEYFGEAVDIMKTNDIVSYLDKSKCEDTKRDKIVLCLRSDKESAMSKQDKKLLQSYCELLTDKVLITDTVIGIDVTMEERESVLEDKWKVFRSSRLVVTDRLHGMIFSLITKTPCVVLGNNHHKVKATYETFKECEYLYYAESVQEAGEMIKKVYKNDLPDKKMNTEYNFIALKEKISCN